MVWFHGERCFSGSEADFSSSSSTGSLKKTCSSSGKKAPPRSSRMTRVRTLPIFKPAVSPAANRDAELYAPYRTPPRVTSSTNSSCQSSPSARRVSLGQYHSCGDNHGIRAPLPEQYLTPLQQKEVSIRHLRTKLLESESRVRDRQSEIEELKGQLGRMREDWIEEECHRVEAQLSLKEARKEIKQLRQVVETMKSSLMEKDKGIQKYFIDINIQNRKLESLLHSMELAQNGSSMDNEPTLDFICDGPSQKKLLEVHAGLEQGAEAMADSGLLVNDEMANRADILEQVFMSTAVDSSHGEGTTLSDHLSSNEPHVASTIFTSTAVDCSQDASARLRVDGAALSDLSSSEPHVASTTVTLSHVGPSQEEKGVQTEPMPCDIQTLLLQLLKFHGVWFEPHPENAQDLTNPVSLVQYNQPLNPKNTPDFTNPVSLIKFDPALNPKNTEYFNDPPSITYDQPLNPKSTQDFTNPVSLKFDQPLNPKNTPDLTNPPSSIPEPSLDTSVDSGVCSSDPEPRFMEELDFEPSSVERSLDLVPSSVERPLVEERYWSSSFLVDLVTVAAPVLPTVAWMYSRHGVDGSAPFYNLAALIRGCCIVGLRSLRHVAHKPPGT